MTRPILLHVLKTHRLQSLPRDKIPQSATTLCELCIGYARDSCRLLTDSWIDGSFMMFDYSFTQYMFASATLVRVASLLPGYGAVSDLGSFHRLAEFLSQLKSNGNFVAVEFCAHIEALEHLLSLDTLQHTHDLRKQTASGARSNLEHSEGLPEASGSISSNGAIFDLFRQDAADSALSDVQFIDDSLLSHDAGLYWLDDIFQTQADGA